MPTPFDDVDAFFELDECVTAVWASQQSTGAGVSGQVDFVGMPGERAFDAVSVNEYGCRYRVAQWPAVRPGDRVTIGAVIYEVREALPIDDGLLARAALRRLN